MAGTVDYMPPEQANDVSTADHRADIYSLGCTFYFILTGKPPFDGRTVLQRVLAHRETPPPSLVEKVGDASIALDAIFQKMLAKSRDDRFQSMDDVLAELDKVLPESNSSPIENVPRVAQDMTVLIVEESRLQAGMISKMLGTFGVDDVHVASNAADAIAKLVALPTHVVLVSSELSDMSGLEFAERIRDQIRWARVPVLIMASSPLPEPTAEAIRRIGSAGQIQKPFDSEQLSHAIDKLLSSDTGESGVVTALATRRVLIVDDSSVARRKIQQTLMEIGFVEFSMAEDGVAGASQLKDGQFDLVITDYNMPRMDGEQFVSWIRSESTQRDVPIIMVTTEFDPSKLAQVYQLGVSAICGKSFEADQVRNIVVRLFL